MEAGRSIARLSTSIPSLLVRLSELVGIAALRSLWTWLALVLATLATLRRRLKKTRASAIYLATSVSSSPLPQPPIPFPELMSFAPRSASSSSISTLEEEEEDELPMRIGGCVDGEQSEESDRDPWETIATGREIVRAWGDERLRVRVNQREVQMRDERRGAPVVGRWEMRGMLTGVAGVATRSGVGAVVYVDGEDGEMLALDVRNGRWVSVAGNHPWCIDGDAAAATTVAAWSPFGLWT